MQTLLTKYPNLQEEKPETRVCIIEHQKRSFMSSNLSRPTMEAHMQPKQNMAQRLIMSAHMQQALHLLQIPLLELEPFIEEQVTQNPVLEISENEATSQENRETIQEIKDETAPIEQEVVINEHDFTILKQLDEEFHDHFTESEGALIKKSREEEKYQTYVESSVQTETNLYAQLIQEAHDTFEEAQDLNVAEILIGYIDELGFLKTPLQEIALLHNLDLDAVEHVLKEIQTFEPYGVGAASIQESLLIQLRCLNKADKLAYTIIRDHYDDLLYNHIPAIQKSLKCSFADIESAIEHDIATLDLHPGMHFSLRKNQPLVPDVSLRQEEDELIVDINREHVPHLRLNRQYLRLLEDTETPLETKNYIRRHVFSARWLMRNLQQRYSTIERIAASLARRQKEFFLKSDGKLVPLTMKSLAEELNVHESTIARTVSNKYIDTPRGLIALRSFFTTEYISDQGELLSSKTVQEAILQVIENENKIHPLSDDKISNLLKERGILCARRTIAKHRNILNIGNTLQRKNFSDKK
jgi:RNA polymerase sigma-54 factor